MRARRPCERRSRSRAHSADNILAPWAAQVTESDTSPIVGSGRWGAVWLGCTQ